jgi:hypothetical protein
VLPQAYRLVLPRCYDASQLRWLPPQRCNYVLLLASDALQSNRYASQYNFDALLRCSGSLQFCFFERTRG